MVNNIKANYRNAEIGNRYDGKYRVASIGSGTVESIIERLTTLNKTQLIYLILEETNG